MGMNVYPGPHMAYNQNYFLGYKTCCQQQRVGRNALLGGSVTGTYMSMPVASQKPWNRVLLAPFKGGNLCSFKVKHLKVTIATRE